MRHRASLVAVGALAGPLTRKMPEVTKNAGHTVVSIEELGASEWRLLLRKA